MIEKISWTKSAWSDYLYWQAQDKKTLKRINLLIENMIRTPFEGIGKPEKLKENLSGFLSRRIDGTHRIVDIIINKYRRFLMITGMAELIIGIPWVIWKTPPSGCNLPHLNLPMTSRTIPRPQAFLR